MTDIELVRQALKARLSAYAPYSNHPVGAALECADGEIILGCNIENAGYTPSNCAERTAFFKAVSEGKMNFSRIAVVGGMKDKDPLDFCAPCGVCRQVMMEFCNPDTFEIILAKAANPRHPEVLTDDDIEIKKYTLKEILPMGFGPNSLK